MPKKVVIGLSGGVDSSVAAYLLKQQGYEVEAMFMQNWHDATGTLHGDCPWKDDLAVAQLVARQLDIPFHFIDLSAPYRQKVVDYMFAEYEKGRTPNPDVLCNREIKFDVFLKACLALGADYVGTGHYCRTETIAVGGRPTYRLLAGSDPNKDQSYFLCQLSQPQLAKALFPIGHLLKPEVRKIAAQLNLPTANKKDSQGICFVGKVDLPVFLQQKLKAKQGEIVELPKDIRLPQRSTLEAQAQPYRFSPSDGKRIGEHGGAHFYTVGQRKGLGVGGHVEPLFVVATDVEHNVVYVGEGHAHPALSRSVLLTPAGEVRWLRPDLAMHAGEQRSYLVRIRYRQPLQQATLHCRREGVYVAFAEPQRGVTSGQFAAWYDGEELLGSGVIA
ncbi:MAG: tRNA 2-thiouridine(34) synthase MnmA [Prevotellaceae bacterium]|jgi:tRNA-specific 2-thiouridylase|nr:tRNA 2-thiouridine(34) synthase MnmA [Prevotellaceae bacterium]